MAIAHDASKKQSRITSLLTSDFCPWANRFVYWLKEPVGWFVLATAASVIIGLYANPVGWTIAGALTGIMVVGMVWPLIAIWSTSCSLRPELGAVHEESSCRMIFTVRNRLPIPQWGLSVEGYLDSEGDDKLPTVALSHVPPICCADYSIEVQPQLRGHYPIQKPSIACSFPFGIWTARRELASVDSLTVWPRVYEIAGFSPLRGTVRSESGDGQRSGGRGDFVGVRGFRLGDSPRHIHWAQSARTETLIVTERGGPQCVNLDLYIDPTVGRGQSRQSLANRIRVAASIFCNLHASHVPMRVSIGGQVVRHGCGSRGRKQLLDALADVPADGMVSTTKPSGDTGNARIEVTGDHDQVVVTISDPNTTSRAAGRTRRITVCGARPLDEQLVGFWQELGYVTVAA